MREWWAQVTLAPEEIKIIVLSKGTSKGLKGDSPKGGQTEPSSIVGAKLLWKNAQKKEEKNKTSETINKIIPYRNPSSTIEECKPWKAPSTETSRHHWTIVIRIIINPKNIKFAEFMWNHFTSPQVKKNAPMEAINGHGDSSTKW